MNVFFPKYQVALRIWITTSLVFGLCWLIAVGVSGNFYFFWTFLIAIPVAAVGSLPVLVILLITLPLIKKLKTSCTSKIQSVAAICLGCTIIYGVIGGLMFSARNFGENLSFKFNDFLQAALVITVSLFGCALIAIFYHKKSLFSFFSSHQIKKILS